MNDLDCGYMEHPEFCARVAQRLALSFPAVHSHSQSMATLAQEIRRAKNAALCFLPFCCTVEAEALGGRINLGDAQTGPRSAAFVCAGLRDVLHQQHMDVSRGRIAQVLQACALLHKKGECVALELSGPLTILNWLMDVSVVFRQWHKDATVMRDVLDRLQENIFAYAVAAGKAGVTVISYADPSGSLSTLGPQRFAFLAENFVLPFLRKMQTTREAPLVHLCPKTAHPLVKLGYATWQAVPTGSAQNYASACLTAGHKTALGGQACLKNDAYFLPGGMTKTVVLV